MEKKITIKDLLKEPEPEKKENELAILELFNKPEPEPKLGKPIKEAVDKNALVAEIVKAEVNFLLRDERLKGLVEKRFREQKEAESKIKRVVETRLREQEKAQNLLRNLTPLLNDILSKTEAQVMMVNEIYKLIKDQLKPSPNAELEREVLTKLNDALDNMR